MANNNPFAQIGTAGPQKETGVYVLPGDHLFDVRAVKLVFNEQENTNYFVAELTKVKSTNPDMAQEPSWAVQIPGKHKYGLTDSRAFIAAMLKAPFEAIDAEMAAGVCSPDAHDEYVKGSQVQCSAALVKTKSGGEFTKMIWKAV